MAAWTSLYKYGLTSPYGTPLAYGIIAVKKELIYNGFSKEIKPESNLFGNAAKMRTIDFQRSKNLIPDGVIGPRTSKELFKKRVLEQEKYFFIPDNYLCKQLSLESAFDPAAVGYTDPRDRGIAQINSFWHPNVDDNEAFDPSFAIPWSARYLSENISSLGDIEAGVVAHNTGRYYARRWLEAGKPEEGLYSGAGKDYAYQCTRYLSLINKQTC